MSVPMKTKPARRAVSPRLAPGAETRARLLDVAEALFAERGYHGVSLREIVASAHVNVAAAHYHFGSKEALFEQVFSRCAEPVCRHTIQMLDMADEWAGRPEYLAQIIKAHLVPTLRAATGDSHDVQSYNRLRAHIMVQDRDFAGKLMSRIYSDLTRRSLQSLQSAMPSLPPKDLAWRFHLLVQTLIFTTIPAGRVHDCTFRAAYSPDDPDEAITYLVPLLVAMFTAPAQKSRGRRRPAIPEMRSRLRASLAG